MITLLSLVNKLNLDVEIQLADSLAFMADLVYKIKMNNVKKPSKMQSMMIKLVERKMNNKSNPDIFEILA